MKGCWRCSGTCGVAVAVVTLFGVLGPSFVCRHTEPIAGMGVGKPEEIQRVAGASSVTKTVMSRPSTELEAWPGHTHRRNL